LREGGPEIGSTGSKTINIQPRCINDTSQSHQVIHVISQNTDGVKEVTKNAALSVPLPSPTSLYRAEARKKASRKKRKKKKKKKDKGRRKLAHLRCH
jgi:ribosome recycling factor